jgi:hypothetical protein
MVQHVKNNRDPRWEEEFTFMLDEPPRPTNNRLHVEVVSTSSRMGLLQSEEHKFTSQLLLFWLVGQFQQQALMFLFLG